ncbi:MAG TPA: winged helix-turn-helix domain-containing protein [Solirubrobacteraceae bacterium]|nr:winged helix-turn-helix domain-containing protein [Solirubrobacteraceae bacterium]
MTVAVAPADFSNRVGLRWSEVDSELGSARILVVRLDDDGPRFALTSYDEAPSPVVTIAADSDATEQDIDLLLRELKVRRSEVLDRVGVRAIDDGTTRTSRSRTAQRAGRASPAKRSGHATVQSRAKATRSGTLHVLKLLHDRPGITVPELAQHVAISERSLYRLMSRLEHEDKVRKKGRGWHLVPRAVRRAN